MLVKSGHVLMKSVIPHQLAAQSAKRKRAYNAVEARRDERFPSCLAFLAFQRVLTSPSEHRDVSEAGQDQVLRE